MEKTKLNRGKRASEEQKTYLIDYLELNIDLAHNRLECVDGGRNRELLWSSLADELNALGGANKEGGKWRKFWQDLKQYTKERNAQITDSMKKSGVNGTKVIKPLTELEKRILTIMTPQAVDGDRGVREFGLPDDNYEDIIYLEEDPKEGHIEGPTTTSRSQPLNTGSAETRSPQEEFIPAPASTSQPQLRTVSAGVTARKPVKRPRRFTADNMDKYLEIENKKMEMKREKIELEKEKLLLEKEKLQTLKCIANSLNTIKDQI